MSMIELTTIKSTSKDAEAAPPFSSTSLAGERPTTLSRTRSKVLSIANKRKRANNAPSPRRSKSIQSRVLWLFARYIFVIIILGGYGMQTSKR